MTLDEILADCQAAAAQVAVRHQKDSSRTLYRALAKTYAACALCERDESRQAELMALVEHSTKGQGVQGAGRRYVFKGPKGNNVYILVCRFVWPDRTASYRYAIVLREAAKRQIAPDDLFHRLCNNGGAAELFTTRERMTRSVTTKCLRLLDPVTVDRFGIITLRLRHQPNNTFRAEVLS